MTNQNFKFSKFFVIYLLDISPDREKFNEQKIYSYSKIDFMNLMNINNY